MNDGNIYKVIIFGKEYTVTTDESEAQVRKIAAIVDTLMSTIAGKTMVRDERKIAVLAALRLAREINILEQQLCRRQQDEQQLLTLIDQVLVSSITSTC